MPSLRPVLPTDHSLLFQLYEETMRPHIAQIWGWDAAWQQRNFQEGLLLAPPFVIYNEATLLGYFQIERRAASYHLRMLLLAPAARSQGLGAQLMPHLLRTCHDFGRKMTLCCFKVNKSAKRFYDKNGWIVTDEDEIFWDMENPSYPVASVEQPSENLERAVCGIAFK